MLAMPGDFDNSMFDMSSRWANDFEINHPFDYGGGGAHIDGAAGWNRNASTAGMLGCRVEGGHIIDNATGKVIAEVKDKKKYGHWERVTTQNSGGIHGSRLNNKDNPNNIDEITVAEKWVWDIAINQDPILKFVGFNHGIPEFESRLMPSGTAVTPGPFIIYSPGNSSEPYFNTHEPGHVVQFYLLGPYNYIRFIAIPSLISVTIFPNQHNDMPWETSANKLWFWLTGERYEDPLLIRKK
jgi:hypothetical protein